MTTVIVVDPERTGTVTTSSSGSGTTAAALLRLQPRDVWQAAANGAAHIIYDRGANAGPVDTVAVLFSNVDIGSSWRVRIAPDIASLTDGTHGRDSGLKTVAAFKNSDIQPRRHIVHVFDTPITQRYVRVDLSKAGAPVIAGRLIVGLAWRPVVGLGMSRAYSGGLAETDTVGGSTILERREARPSLSMEMVSTSRAEFDELALGLQQFHREVMAVIDPESPEGLQQRIYYGPMRGTGISDDGFQFFRHRMEIVGLT